MTSPLRALGAAWRRALAPSDEIDAERARMSAERAGFDSVRDITTRCPARLTGFISSMVIHPRSSAPTVEAELFDGTGSITLIWRGREEIPGIVPGTRLAVSGFAAPQEARHIMHDPRYEIIARPGEEEQE